MTPRDLGLPWEEVDPVWHEAVLRIGAGFAEGQKEKMDKASSKVGRK